jgi:hypothetical protein
MHTGEAKKIQIKPETYFLETPGEFVQQIDQQLSTRRYITFAVTTELGICNNNILKIPTPNYE